MLVLLLRRLRKASSAKQTKRSNGNTLVKEQPSNVEIPENTRTKTCECNFSRHMSKYIGETVTIYVKSGGVSGAGFTGVLFFVNDSFVRLLSTTGPTPACSTGNPCCRYHIKHDSPLLHYQKPLYGKVFALGSTVNIPVTKIVSFVHNTV